ncbi:flagellar biosynthetic protein FliO [Luteimonas sp. JM171]|uniref:flagellar biosynthetic protein FliO n=1 Tax=Luteimonas sp. JM171 TaxID=1896164 RepID=UPI0008577382|nr:flagellar biosynthetic protein FliO [Luteimonas sp. JM171]AOH35918.1 hypothetical protein BGP89_05710 [Luteimonas sp. JM171]
MPDRSVALRFATAIAIALTAAAGTAFAAAPEAAMPSPSYVRELLGILVPLAFMIVALLLVLRLLRRRYGMTGSGAHLSVLQILPVGPRERVVLLKTRAGRILAIGVSAQSVNLITRLEQDDVAAEPDAGQ